MVPFGWCEPVATGTVPALALIDPKERAEARAEVDALVAKEVFGLTEEDVAYTPGWR